MTGQSSTATLTATARDVFGWPRLRPGQQEAMQAVLGGRDTLVVMPTGAGKSAIYQVPALLLPGPTVIVSPLIALQHDQVAGLLRRTDAPGAVAVNSAQSNEQTRQAWRALKHGDAEYVFIAPEQLAKEETVSALAALRPRLFVVDEAQCISAWGHDFRPDYQSLGRVTQKLGRPTVLALTATAAPPVRRDIAGSLRMRDPLVLVAGFDRPNLSLAVTGFLRDEDKRAAVVERAASLPKPGLVYAATRKDTEGYAAELTKLGLAARAYHAGLKAAERESVHQAFLSGKLDVVVATSAFGMGIDKPDVRFVLHASVPESLDAYYQQIGRAGRDGAAAEVLLCYRAEDLGLQRFLTAGGPDVEALRAVASARDRAVGGRASAAEIQRGSGLSRRRVTAAVNLLQLTGDTEEKPDEPEAAVERAVAVAEQQRQVEQSRLEMMRGYAETTGCRRHFLLGYFGEATAEVCGNCDSCRSGSAHRDTAPADGAFAVGAAVRHREWGEGTVLQVEQDRVTVLFASVGYRTLSVPAVQENNLVETV
ncbi:MAG TPA: RecQ family ATP-dependent DNA helicase [Actinospica sp.]|jgi:ATP-dependent DNA helicase RecQ|nr:RecQ family ATP-dependent DNA helicase [Actinospica sp.]